MIEYYNKLGNSGLKVSRLGVGTYNTFGVNVTTDDAISLVKLAARNGVNFFDTADTYADGVAEIILGKALKYLPRGDFVLSTKCFFPISNIPSNSGLSKKHIVDSVNRSLVNCKLDYIDFRTNARRRFTIFFQ